MPVEIFDATVTDYSDALTISESQQLRQVLFAVSFPFAAKYQLAKVDKNGSVYWDQTELVAQGGAQGGWDQCYGIRFRSYNPANPTVVQAIGCYLDDPIPEGFTPSSQTFGKGGTSSIAGGTLISVTDYGAVGDDVTDDTTAINNALAIARTKGVPLFFPKPPVAYLMTSSLALQSGDTLWGERSTIDIQTDHTRTGRSLLLTNCQNVEVKSITIACNNAVARNQVYGMVTIFGGNDILMEDVWVTSGEGTGFFTGTPGETNTVGVHRLRMIRCKVSGVFADGIHMSRGIQDSWIIEPEVNNVGDDGIACVSILTDNGVNNYDQIKRVHIVNPIVRDITSVTGSGIYLGGTQDCEILGGSAFNINNPSAGAYGASISFNIGGNGAGTYGSSDNRIIGFSAKGCKVGISIGATTDALVESCEGIANVTVGIGIQIIEATNTHVVGGKYIGNSALGVYGHLGALNNVIAADLRGNTANPYVVDGNTTISATCVT